MKMSFRGAKRRGNPFSPYDKGAADGGGAVEIFEIYKKFSKKLQKQLLRTEKLWYTTSTAREKRASAQIIIRRILQ